MVEQMVKCAHDKSANKLIANTADTCQLLAMCGRAVVFRPVPAVMD
jgi:hypothetical protein